MIATWPALGRGVRHRLLVAAVVAGTVSSCQRSAPEGGDVATVVSDLRARFGSDPQFLSPGVSDGFQRVEGGLRPRFGARVRETGDAEVVLPERSTAALRLEDVDSGVRVEVTLQGARDAVAETAAGYVFYRNAHASGASVLHRPSREGVEDFLSFGEHPESSAVAYRVALRRGVAGLRLVANTLEMLDAGGAPRLRVAPPYLVGADGARTDAILAIEGCRVDRNAAGPWRRPVTAPGADACTLRVSWRDGGVVYPAVLDPRWTTTTNTMTSARQDHTATLMSNGIVLVAGGRTTNTGTTGLTSAELFDNATGTWSTTNAMTGGRWSHSATQLGTSSNTTTSGRVLIAGGRNGTASLTTAQLYTPGAGTWATAGALVATAREQHTETLLPDGRVLVVGGVNGTMVLNTAATYSQGTSGGGSWTAVSGTMASARRFHTATLLSTSNASLNGKVMVTGGNSGGTTSVLTVQLFDGTSGWTNLTGLPSTREGHTATMLASGKVLVTGGRSGTGTLNTTSLFDPVAGTWATAGTMTTARQAHTASLFPSTLVGGGQVLLVGGSNGTNSLATGELWNGTTTWTATATSMPTAVQGHTATSLSNNSVLIAGGLNGTATVNTARTYDPSFALSCTTNSQCSSGFCVGGVCCDTACNGGCGSCTLSGKVGTCSPITSGTSCRAAVSMCDVAETCNGTSVTCPTDAFAPSTTTCRSAVTTCDVAEKCTGTSSVCPADAFAPATTTCRAAVSACDLAENCTGTSTVCPADVVAPSTTPCRAAAAECDVAETCTGTSTTCPADVFKANLTACTDDGNACTKDQCNGTSATCQHPAGNAGAVCRAAAAECDVAETCSGTSTTCPADVLKANLTACSDEGNPCTKDQCNGTSAACQHPAGNAGSVCRAAAAECDLAETCSGTSTACPTDVFKANLTACSDEGNPCTKDQCNGTSAACQHTAANAGAVCRAAAAECDVAETCTGTSTTCPTDVFKANLTACADEGNPCTKDQCNGASAACQHPAGNAGTVCRASAGMCDVAESCTGTSTACPVDAFVSSTTVCRSAVTTCDVAEKCTGSSAACPTDGFAPATTTCRAATGECDAAEMCTGTGTACPADVLKPNLAACTDDGNACTKDQCNGTSAACQHPAGNAGTVCRASAGTCDVAESCNGTSTSCPTDAFASSTTTCRPAAGECDTAERCTGTTAACPADALKASLTACTDDGNVCTKDQCDGVAATCQHPAGNAGTVCRTSTGACDMAESCTGTSTACPSDGTVANGTPCPDGNGCNGAEVCQAGTCVAGTPVVCKALDQCHTVGTCNPATGTCSNPVVPNGTACQDGSLCTTGEVCSAGVCQGQTSTCPGGSSCMPSTGQCATPATCPQGFDYDGAGRLVGDCEKWLSYDVYDHLQWVAPGPSSQFQWVLHGYGADGQRSMTQTMRNDGTSAIQVWFTPDYSEHDGVRDHYFRVGDRLIARVTVQPPAGGGTGAGLTSQRRSSGGGGGDRGDLVAKLLMGLLLAAGLASVAAGLIGRRRRPVWISGTAGVVLLSLFAACEMWGSSNSAARLVWSAFETVYFHQGVAAGPVVMTTSTGTLFEERRYEPFGSPVEAYRPTGIVPIDPKREPQNSLGKLTDPASGFSDHGARWMMPETARWTSPDPALRSASVKHVMNPGDLNPYGYVRQNPAVFWDPNGKFALEHHYAISESALTTAAKDYPGKWFPSSDQLRPAMRYMDTFGQVASQYHFDDSNFRGGFSWVDSNLSQYKQARDAVGSSGGDLSWIDKKAGLSLFRALHSVEDFYAHTNYVSSFLSYSHDGAVPTFEEVFDKKGASYARWAGFRAFLQSHPIRSGAFHVYDLRTIHGNRGHGVVSCDDKSCPDFEKTKDVATRAATGAIEKGTAFTGREDAPFGPAIEK